MSEAAARPALGLFEAFGVEVEYMIVDRMTLDVQPIADVVLAAVGGAGSTEVELGELAWSNELALHVLELKTNGPRASLDGLGDSLVASVQRANAVLESRGAILMPTGMHPWMDPERELRIWPHEAGPIYQAFDRIFDCRGHGWANLQSTHLNLPFATEAEFGRLHEAIRLLLPIMPALAASSPYVDGTRGRALCTRMDVYRNNAVRVPSVCGGVVPVNVATPDAYQTEILQPIYEDLATLDPRGVLRHEWVNARGCIARFDRGAIEVRVLDTQEYPGADVALCAAVAHVTRTLVERRVGDLEASARLPTAALQTLFGEVLVDADATVIDDADYLSAVGFSNRRGSAAEVWAALLDASGADDSGASAPVEAILEHGCLARRLVGRLGSAPSATQLRTVYRELVECLAEGRAFGVA